jgi:hypothetical protein
MTFYSAEIGKKTVIIFSETTEQAQSVLEGFFKIKSLKLIEIILQQKLVFKVVKTDMVCTMTKAKGSVIYFTTERSMSGKIDISLMPIEPVEALP